VGHVARVGHENWKRTLEDLGVDWKIILDWTLGCELKASGSG
jgi:hypothetical protein